MKILHVVLSLFFCSSSLFISLAHAATQSGVRSSDRTYSHELIAAFSEPKRIASAIEKNPTASTPLDTAPSATLSTINFSTIDGTQLSAYLDVVGIQPKKAVLICHGYTEDADFTLPVIADIRASDSDDQVLIMSLNYRNNLDYPALLGAQDVLYLLQDALMRYPSIEEVFLFGNSMGGEICATAASELGTGNYNFKHPVPLHSLYLMEAVNNLKELFEDARFLADNLKLIAPEGAATLNQVVQYINQDIAKNPSIEGKQAAFERRSPLFQVGNIEKSGVKNIVIVQSIFDGTVPDDQSIEMTAAVGLYTKINWESVQVATKLGADNAGTSIASRILSFLSFLKSPNLLINLVGHSSTGDVKNPVICEALQRLNQELKGKYTPSNKITVKPIDFCSV